ncbi:uncharacterized protein E5676_scaffold177G00130 [Cucumis melo var. makuwa]|uniref:Uncharacterized protein n=2 Tax=Cucumis melo TaxID=3656 RepID=A0A5D3CJZ3_CUCMM|nr:uncharacterized protein E5676_scaffold177G00130 [Cucumis melo var. makuwa]
MASKSIDMSDDANDLDAKKKIDKMALLVTYDWDQGQCKGAGTIFDYNMDGDNVKVSVDIVADGNCFVPVPTRESRTMLSQEVGSQLLWPRHLVIPLDEKMKSMYEAHPRLPSLTLNTKRAPVTLRLLLWKLDYIGSKI